MSAPIEPTAQREPKVGESFIDTDGDSHEIEEVANRDDLDPGEFEVASDGDFYNIKWGDEGWMEIDEEEED